MFSRVTRSQFSLGLGSLYLQTQRKTSSTSDKSEEQFFKLNKATKDKAKKLIDGKRTYQEFTPEEKKLVDWYQDLILKEYGGVVFPNTRVDWEQQKAAKLFEKKDKESSNRRSLK